METKQTSTLAYDKYRADGKKERDHKIILWVLSTYGRLTAFGIAKRAFYKVMENGRERTRKLDYIAVNRRMKELRESSLVEIVDRHKDVDGSLRTRYSLK
ncbi:hypothetical protein J0X14_14450 [Muricauda sp. CAU 1633]|uniref:hypothetical protein n=1 Tax=Allomuricauda sp. CAU 1633 TaxID=2816036 RepID=UPI001A8FF40D|nr:hypothetical protein [Muricauda sp. CAU 1633]MBO0323506.1 hypothetical protein [Muricauda sp. CAU 1633]